MLKIYPWKFATWKQQLAAAPFQDQQAVPHGHGTPLRPEEDIVHDLRLHFGRRFRCILLNTMQNHANTDQQNQPNI